MVYYEQGDILIRDMVPGDAPILTREEIAQGWDQSIEKYEMRLRHQAEGRSIALIAEYRGQVAGYLNVYPDSPWGAFGGQGLPELVDFGVLEKYRRQGIGSLLYAAVLAFARDKNCYHVTLNVWACNPGAEAFYRALGMGTMKTTLEAFPPKNG